MSYRAAFVILAGGAILNLPLLKVLALVAGYTAFEQLDVWLAKRARNNAVEKVFEDEVYGWKPDTESPEMETKGDYQRVKLVGHEQVIVTRVADLMRRIALLR